MEALTREEVRSIDRCAIDRLGVPGVVLMENAGRNAVDAIEDFAGPCGGRSVAVVAGGGNNGGDGFVIARHLVMRGAKVVTFLIAPEDKIAGDAHINLDIIRNLGHDIRRLRQDLSVADLLAPLGRFDLIIDAAGGTGIDGSLRGDLAAAIERINAAPVAVVAVDIPTGLDCDTGKAAGPAVRADMTVTFVARKKGFDAPGADAYTGEVRVADIGVPAERVRAIAAE